MLVAKPFRIAAAALMLLAAAPAPAAFVVNTDNDADDAGDGVCSLREAIIAVNTQADYHECTSANTGESFVSFAIAPNAGETHTIALTSALPPVMHFIGLDGTTQSGTTCAPVPNVRIEITNPSNLVGDGLSIEAGAALSDVRGLAISGFDSQEAAGLRIYGNDVRVGCMVVGTNASGTTAQPNWYGIFVNAPGVDIGVATVDEWLPNLLSGNSMANLYIEAGGSDALVAGNTIGPDGSGTATLQSAFGIYNHGASGVHVGYTTADVALDRQRNVIAIASAPSTTAVNVSFDTTMNTVFAGNHVGVAADGQTLLPIGTGIGITVSKGSSTLIGCDGYTPAQSCRNVIANPSGVATEVFEGSSNVAIVGNYIGVAADGTTVFNANAATTGVVLSGANALVARNLVSTGAMGTGILLSPNLQNETPVFLNQTTAGTAGAVLDSSGNCVQGNAYGVDTSLASNPTVISTDFLNNWWGAADGPAPNGSGDSVSSNINYMPFLTAAASVCAADAIFANGFE